MESIIDRYGDIIEEMKSDLVMMSVKNRQEGVVEESLIEDKVAQIWMKLEDAEDKFQEAYECIEDVLTALTGKDEDELGVEDYEEDDYDEEECCEDEYLTFEDKDLKGELVEDEDEDEDEEEDEETEEDSGTEYYEDPAYRVGNRFGEENPFKYSK